MTSGKLVDKLTKIPNGYKNGIPWSAKPVKVPLIKMEDGSPFDIWNWKLSTRPWPQLNCQNVLFLKRRPQLLRAGRRRDKNLILICHLSLEERWAEFAQLFTFYWDLTRNKFSFPLSFFVTRSPLFIWTFGLTPSWNLEEIDSAINWSTGQAWRNWMKTIDGSQAPRSGSIRHITYVRVGDNRALHRNWS